MEEERMYELFKVINKDGVIPAGHPSTFINALEVSGLIKVDYNKTYLTSLGQVLYKSLSSQIEKW